MVLKKKNKKDKIVPLEPKEGEIVDVESKKNIKKGNIVIGTLNVFTYPVKKAAQVSKKRYDVRYKYNVKHLMFDVFLIGGIGLMIALNIFFFFFLADVLVDRTKLEISTSPEEVVSGNDIVYNFEYKNDNKFRIEEANIAVKFPEGFSYKESDNSTFNSANNTFSVGDLEPGGNGQTKITGLIVGEVGSSQLVSATISYLQIKDEEGQVKKQRKKIENLEYIVSSSVLYTEVGFPQKVVNSQNFDFEIRYKNTSNNDLEGVSIKPAWQEGFSFVQSDPSITNQGWYIGRLNSGDEGKISVKAHIVADGQLNRDFKISPIIIFEGTDLNQGDIIKTAEIIYPKFLVTQKINNQDDYEVSPGEIVEYIVFYKNDENTDITDLSLEVELLSEYFDLNTIEAESATIENGRIKWSQDQLVQLSYIKKDQTGEVKFKVKTKPKVDIRNLGDKKENISLISQVKALYKLEGQNVELVAARADNKLSSYLEIQSYGRYYYEGEQLGRGPIPPIVGEETKYWIFWNVANTTNKVKNVKVSGKLPPNVSWTGEQGFYSNVEYNPANREVTWFIEDVNVHTGVIYPSVGAAFAVRLTPSEAQLGTEPLLLRDIRITGEDEFTGQFLENPASDVSTNLVYDERAQFLGTKVVEY